MEESEKESDVEKTTKGIIEIKVEFGIDIEYKSVKYTLKELDWLNSHGYKPIMLPKGITKGSSKKEIQDQIEKEFDEKKYKRLANQINSSFSTIKNQFSKKLHQIFNNIPSIFVIHLTNYGVGGSYHLPNTVVCFIHNIKYFEVIVHEIIHLLIENQVQKYKIKHWEKERIVDLILSSEEFSFLGYDDWQDDYHEVEGYIDILFNSHFFQNPEEFFSKIRKVRA
jgi:hypothetical protein